VLQILYALLQATGVLMFYLFWLLQKIINCHIIKDTVSFHVAVKLICGPYGLELKDWKNMATGPSCIGHYDASQVA
jgi:hypothetical protein